MFKAIIIETNTIIVGNAAEKLAGLMCYIDALYESKIPGDVIEEIIKDAIEENRKRNGKNEYCKIQKIGLNNFTKEEVEKVFKKELEKMFGGKENEN